MQPAALSFAFSASNRSEDLQAKGLEVVFVSGDHSEEEFKEYFAEMPWLAVDFAQKAENKSQECWGFPVPLVLPVPLNTCTAVALWLAVVSNFFPLSGGQHEAQQEVQGILPSFVAPSHLQCLWL